MSVLLVVLGPSVMVFAIVDAAMTTLAVSTPSGPLTARSSHAVARLLRSAAARFSLLRGSVGPGVLTTTIAQWIGLLWGGWALTLMASPDAVVAADDGSPAGGWARLYYASYTLFTLGVGDFVPGEDIWRVATAVATIAGLAVVTASITYLVPVVTAVTEREAQAARIAGLGQTAQQILANTWDGSGFSGLEHRLESVADDVVLTTQRHLTYPVLHFFSARDRSTSFAVNVAAMDEAVGLLEVVIPASQRPSALSLRVWRHAVERLLAVVEEGFGESADDLPPLPSLSPLVRAGLPVDVNDDAVQRAAERRASHRRRLHGFVLDSGWRWEDVATAR